MRTLTYCPETDCTETSKNVQLAVVRPVNPSRYPNLRMLAPSPLLLCALYGIHGPITFAYYVPAVRHVKELTREHVSGLLRGLQSGLLAQSLRKLHRRVEEARDTFRSEKECRA